jgi:dTDP-4-dehydrorhamnose reductase
MSVTMKILITGADGALGTEMQSLLKKHGIIFMATDIKQLDITDFKKTNEMLLNYRPTVILHFAALSDVDLCEEDTDLALRVNALSTLGLATIARKIDAKMLYVSTNFVFDGTGEQPYYEYSKPQPVNHYGVTKLLGEQYVRDICSRFFIVRTSWLFGSASKTFISKFIASPQKPASIHVICDQFALFTYTVDLAEAILTLIKTENYGVYHLANREIGSWLDFALRAKDVMKFKTSLNPITTDELNLPALRPRYAPLGSRNYGYLFDRTMRTWKDALAAFIASLQQSR